MSIYYLYMFSYILSILFSSLVLVNTSISFFMAQVKRELRANRKSPVYDGRFDF